MKFGMKHSLCFSSMESKTQPSESMPTKKSCCRAKESMRRILPRAGGVGRGRAGAESPGAAGPQQRKNGGAYQCAGDAVEHTAEHFSAKPNRMQQPRTGVCE